MKPGRTATAGARPQLSRNVIVLSWVSFFQDAASEMLYPIIPIFLTTVLGASPAIVGVIEGFAEGTASLLKGYAGWLADRMARRPLVIGGYALSSVAKLLLAFASSWAFVLACRVLDRAGKGVRGTPRDALIVADTPPAARGRAFGFHRAVDTAGAIVGPLVGLGLYELLAHNLRAIFFASFVPAVVSVGLIGFVRESPRVAQGARVKVVAERLSRRYWSAIALLSIFALANFSDALIILRLKVVGFGVPAIMGAYALYNVSYAALSYPAGIVSDRVPRRLVFAAGIALFAVSYLAFGLVSTPSIFWGLMLLYGAYMALTDGVGKAWVAEMAPEARTGVGLGIYQATMGVGSVVAGAWAGLAWGASGSLPFVVAGLVAATVATILALTPTRRDPTGTTGQAQ